MKRDEKLRMLERMRVQSAALSTTHSSSFSCPVVPASTLLFVKYYCSQLLLRHVVTFSKGGGGGRTNQLLRSSLDNSPEWIGPSTAITRLIGKTKKERKKERKEGPVASSSSSSFFFLALILLYGLPLLPLGSFVRSFASHSVKR